MVLIQGDTQVGIAYTTQVGSRGAYTPMFLDSNDIDILILCISYKFVKTGWWIQCSSVEGADKSKVSTLYKLRSR